MGSINNKIFRKSGIVTLSALLVVTIGLGLSISDYDADDSVKTAYSSTENIRPVFSPPPFGVLINVPLESGQTLQEITVKKGESIDIPVTVVGGKPLGDQESTVSLVVENLGRVDDLTEHNIFFGGREPPERVPTEMDMSFAKNQMTLNKDSVIPSMLKATTTNLESGIYLISVDVTNGERTVGTTFNLKVTE